MQYPAPQEIRQTDTFLNTIFKVFRIRAKLGTEKNPVIFRVKTERRLGEIANICENHGWIFIGGLEPDETEDIREVEYMLNPGAFKEVPRIRLARIQIVVREEPAISRNAPCPCGSGKKYKKCCGAKI